MSRVGGQDPVWSQDSRDLYFRLPGEILAVAIGTEPTFTYGPPMRAFDATGFLQSQLSYAIAPDGNRALLIKDATQSDSGDIPPIIVIENWFEELEALVPVE